MRGALLSVRGAAAGFVARFRSLRRALSSQRHDLRADRQRGSETKQVPKIVEDREKRARVWRNPR
jgi:hypothetical protein